MEDDTKRLIIYQLIMGALILSSVLFGWLYNRKLPLVDKLAIMWFMFDGLVHILLEGSFLYVSIGGTAQNSTSIISYMWKDFGKNADTRYLHADPTIVAMELFIAPITGPLALITVYAIIKDTYYRHFLQIMVCSLEQFGNWMTFVPDFLTGGHSFVTDSFVYFWGNLVFFNIVWIVVPLTLLFQSFKFLRVSHSPRSKKKQKDRVDGQTAKTSPRTTPGKYNFRHNKKD